MAILYRKLDMARSADLTPLINPRTIAIVGASGDFSRIGGVPLALLEKSGFANVYAVNPKYDAIGPFRCFPSIEAIPADIDLAVIATPGTTAMEQLEAAHRKGVKAAIVFASGFAETGDPAGIAMQQAITDFADRTGMAINGPNCLGVVNWKEGVFATFAKAFNPELPAGDTALIGQSGNISSAIYRIARRMNVGFSHAINTGNEACLTVADYLRHIADDPQATSALCYVEALRDGPGFLEAARRMRANGKLVAVFKAGTSERGAEAARSHTAALAGNEVAYKAAFREAGVAHAQSLSHMAELAYMHRFAPRRTGANVGIVSNSGAAGTIIVDGLSAGGMDAPPLSIDLQKALKTVIPSYGMVGNPVDLTGNVANSPEMLEGVLNKIIAADELDVVIMHLGDNSIRRGLAFFEQAARSTDKLLVLVDAFESGLRNEVEACGLAYFEDIERAIRAITTYHAWRNNEPRQVEVLEADAAAAREILSAAIASAPGMSLSEAASKAVLQAGGLHVAGGQITSSSADAVRAADAIGYPVVMKLVSPDVAHKTEIGGVRLGIEDAEATARAYDEIQQNARQLAPGARIDGISVEPMISGACELLVGVVRDPVFGWMMTVGMGGTTTELIGDVSHALLPVDEAGAEAMLRELKTFRLLDGYRGAARSDVAAASVAIARLSSLITALGSEISECEINPLLVMPEGKGAIAADALILLPSQATDQVH
jgi:acyl-CoA synthetase (NDP forming)